MRSVSTGTDDVFGPSPIDRATNPCVTELAGTAPELFSGWHPRDWDQLYSTFGTSGPLTPEGVRTAATRINRRREVTRQLEVLMETHLADVTAELIGTLHRMTRPAADLEPGPRLDELLASLRRK